MKSCWIIQVTRSRKGARILLALLFLATSSQCFADAALPASDDEVLESIPTELLRKERLLREKQRLGQSQPSLEETLKLVRSELDRGHASGDPRYYGHADSLLQPWLNSKPPAADVLLLYATVQQYNHEFLNALETLEKVLDLTPHSAQGWLLKAAIQTTTGSLAEAKKSCSHLYQLAGERVTSACLAVAATTKEDLDRTHILLRNVYSDGPNVDDGSERSWADGIIAEGAERLGLDEEAEAAYLQGLLLTPEDPFLLAAYSDFLLSQSRPQEVKKLLLEHTQMDSLLLRLTIAEKVSSDPAYESHSKELKARFQNQDRRADSVHLRERALYLMRVEEDLTGACRVAQLNWEKQRESIDARILMDLGLMAGCDTQSLTKWLDDTKFFDSRLKPVGKSS